MTIDQDATTQMEKITDRILLAVIQSQDSEILEKALAEHGYTYFRLPSVGGFLQERNVSFLIEANPDNHAAIKALLLETCKKRVTYLAAPVENAGVQIQFPMEIVVGGVSLFTLDIDDYEELCR